MKKVYSKPSVTVVNVRLFSSLLEDPEIGLKGQSVEVEEGFAKENNLEFEEDDTFTTPTQPNLWDDEEQ